MKFLRRKVVLHWHTFIVTPHVELLSKLMSNVIVRKEVALYCVTVATLWKYCFGKLWDNWRVWAFSNLQSPILSAYSSARYLTPSRVGVSLVFNLSPVLSINFVFRCHFAIDTACGLYWAYDSLYSILACNSHSLVLITLDISTSAPILQVTFPHRYGILYVHTIST